MPLAALKPCPHCADLEDEVAALKQELADVKGAELIYPPEWRLTRRQEEVLHVLERAKGPVARESIHTALYGIRPDGGADLRIIDVFICKLRKKITLCGMEIISRYGFGYSLDPAARKVIAEARAKMTGGANAA